MVNISYFSSKNILLIKYILSKISVKRVINMSDSSLLIAVSNLTLNNFCSFLIESMIPKRYSLVKDSFMLSSKLLFWSSVLVPSLSAFCFSNFSIFSIFSSNLISAGLTSLISLLFGGESKALSLVFRFISFVLLLVFLFFG